MTETSVSAKLLDWYDANARVLPWRRPPGAALPADPAWPYRVWLSEIMLQQTTVAAVAPYFARFTERWPTVAALAAADNGEVMAAWAGLGYYARARNLLAGARAVVAEHGGQFPAGEAALRALPGVGAYTAAAIAAIGFGERAVVIDGNVERVVARLFAIDTPLPGASAAIRQFADAITPSTRSGDFAQGMMDLGSSICTPRAPRCGDCPLAADCRAFALGIAETLPVKPAKAARPVRYGTVWWIERDGAVLIVRRPAKGLLGGMTGLPTSEWSADSAPVSPPFGANWRDCGEVRHVFTHFELRLRVSSTVAPTKSGMTGKASWHPTANLAAIGFPTLFAKAAALALTPPLKAAA